MNPKAAASCVMIEVYLPKHITNQSALTDLLLDVLELDKAKAVLLQRIGEIADEWSMRTPVSFGTQDLPPLDARAIIEGMREGLLGYSIYEVDGAFRSDGSEPSSATKQLLRRRVPIRCSKPYPISKALARAFDFAEDGDTQQMRTTERALQRLRARVERKPPVCKDRPVPWRGPTIELDLPESLYVLERVGSAERPKVIATKCLRLYEERTLVVRFLISLSKIASLSESGGSIEPRVIQAFLLVGEYLVESLGQKVTEDEIWIYYDSGFLWRWESGNVKTAAAVGV